MAAPRRTKTGRAPSHSTTGMHTCPDCGSVLVQPVDWQERDDGSWQVELRCPECGWWNCDVHSLRDVDRYDEELDRGGQELMEDLRALTRANMEEELDRLARALASDSILPEDF